MTVYFFFCLCHYLSESLALSVVISERLGGYISSDSLSVSLVIAGRTDRDVEGEIYFRQYSVSIIFNVTLIGEENRPI